MTGDRLSSAVREAPVAQSGEADGYDLRARRRAQSPDDVGAGGGDDRDPSPAACQRGIDGAPEVAGRGLDPTLM
jgi:hypothetical protein